MVQPADGSRGSCGSSSALRNPRAPLPHIVCRCLRWDPPGPTGTHRDPPDLKLAQRVEDVTLVLASAIFSILSTLKSRLHGDYTTIYIKGRTLHEVETSAIREHLLSTWQSDTAFFRLTSSAGIELHIESIWSLSPTGGCVSFVSIS